MASSFDWGRLNILVSPQPWRLFEIADQWFFLPPLRQRSQNLLAAQWAHKVPFLQKVSPAYLAGQLIENALEELEKTADGARITVVDFCSGAGGPTPVMEATINKRRQARGLQPIEFVLSDLHPHLDSWIPLSEGSGHLNFIPQPVDASDPPMAAISETCIKSNKTANGESPSDTRVFRLFCLSFHHFDSQLAMKILGSTMETADGFAILELQDRRLASIILMMLMPLVVWVTTFRWYPYDLVLLFLTYIFPVYPFVHCFDGAVSALRTRTFDEVMQLAVTAYAKRDWLGSYHNRPLISTDYGNRPRRLDVGEWVFEGGRQMHTWPLGYLSFVVGRKVRA